MATHAKFWALLPAAGVGKRVGADLPKQYLRLAGRRVIEHSLSLFVNHARIAGVVVALGQNDNHWATLSLAKSPRLHTVDGGAERQDSVLSGLAYLKTLASEDDWVLVHDAARPCLGRDMLDALIQALENDAVGGLLALPVQDTIKQAEENRVITLDRRVLWQAQTPQMFRLGPLHTALAQAVGQGLALTDDAAAMEHAGYKPRLVAGSADNLKITRSEDLALAEFILKRRQQKGKRH